MASLSERAHHLADRGKEGEAQLRQVEKEIARHAALLWGVTHRELEEIQHALAET